MAPRSRAVHRVIEETRAVLFDQALNAPGLAFAGRRHRQGQVVFLNEKTQDRDAVELPIQIQTHQATPQGGKAVQ